MKSRRSRGAVLLSRLDATIEEVASTVGRSKSLVGAWRTGDRSPTEGDRIALEARYGVPRSAWDEPATTPRGKALPRRPEAPVVSDDERQRGAHELAQELAKRATELLAKVDQDKEAGYRERAAVMTAANQAMALLLRCETDEAKILRSPSWARIQRTIVELVKPHPKLALQIADALEQIQSGTAGV